MTVNNDKAAKILFKDHQIACDLFNGYFFHGEQILKANDLEEFDPVIQFPRWFGEKESQEVQELLADKMYKIVTSESFFLIEFVGIQNQTKVDYGMPLRDLIYIAGILDAEARRIAKINRLNPDPDNFTSKLKRGDQVPGVIMLTVFFSYEQWDGPLTLQQMMSGSERFGHLMVNLPLNLISPAGMSDQRCLEYGPVLGPIFLAIKYSNNENGIEDLFNKYKDLFIEVDIMAALVINSVTNLDFSYDESSITGGKVNMETGYSRAFNRKVQEAADKKAAEIVSVKVKKMAEEMAQEMAEKKAQEMAEKKAQEMAEKKAETIAIEMIRGQMPSDLVVKFTKLSPEKVELLIQQVSRSG